MDRRANLQLRLQQTVEGLSLAAITYYIVGLTGYAAKGVKATGFQRRSRHRHGRVDPAGDPRGLARPEALPPLAARLRRRGLAAVSHRFRQRRTGCGGINDKPFGFVPFFAWLLSRRRECLTPRHPAHWTLEAMNGQVWRRSSFNSKKRCHPGQASAKRARDPGPSIPEAKRLSHDVASALRPLEYWVPDRAFAALMLVRNDTVTLHCRALPVIWPKIPLDMFMICANLSVQEELWTGPAPSS